MIKTPVLRDGVALVSTQKARRTLPEYLVFEVISSQGEPLHASQEHVSGASTLTNLTPLDEPIWWERGVTVYWQKGTPPRATSLE
jgi:hypothetical protein